VEKERNVEAKKNEAKNRRMKHARTSSGSAENVVAVGANNDGSGMGEDSGAEKEREREGERESKEEKENER
jgi:hypothetical protein